MGLVAMTAVVLVVTVVVAVMVRLLSVDGDSSNREAWWPCMEGGGLEE